MKAWLEQAARVARQYRELTGQMSDPAVFQAPERYRKLAKEAAEYEPVATKLQEYEAAERELKDVCQLLADRDNEDLRELAEQEADQLKEKLTRLEAELKELLTPRDHNDDRNVFLEVRAGTGGEEAALFAADLVRMYTRTPSGRGGGRSWSTRVPRSWEDSRKWLCSSKARGPTAG